MTTRLYFPNLYRQIIIKYFPDWKIAPELRKIDEQMCLLRKGGNDTIETRQLLKRYSDIIISGLRPLSEWPLLQYKQREIESFAKKAMAMCGFPPLDEESEFDEYVFKVDEIPQEKIIAINVLLEVKYGLRLKLE